MEVALLHDLVDAVHHVLRGAGDAEPFAQIIGGLDHAEVLQGFVEPRGRADAPLHEEAVGGVAPGGHGIEQGTVHIKDCALHENLLGRVNFP